MARCPSAGVPIEQPAKTLYRHRQCTHIPGVVAARTRKDPDGYALEQHESPTAGVSILSRKKRKYIDAGNSSPTVNFRNQLKESDLHYGTHRNDSDPIGNPNPGQQEGNHGTPRAE